MDIHCWFSRRPQVHIWSNAPAFNVHPSASLDVLIQCIKRIKPDNFDFRTITLPLPYDFHRCRDIYTQIIDCIQCPSTPPKKCSDHMCIYCFVVCLQARINKSVITHNEVKRIRLLCLYQGQFNCQSKSLKLKTGALSPVKMFKFVSSKAQLSHIIYGYFFEACS